MQLEVLQQGQDVVPVLVLALGSQLVPQVMFWSRRCWRHSWRCCGRARRAS